jgi:hypothetical protein
VVCQGCEMRWNIHEIMLNVIQLNNVHVLLSISFYFAYPGQKFQFALTLLIQQPTISFVLFFTFIFIFIETSITKLKRKRNSILEYAVTSF